jgi:hypothetical protein
MLRNPEEWKSTCDIQEEEHVEPKPPQEEEDVVNKPSHYTDGGIETIDFIEAKGLDFNLGNAVKYISRAGKKDPSKKVEDLEKARWYLNREIARLSIEKK